MIVPETRADAWRRRLKIAVPLALGLCCTVAFVFLFSLVDPDPTPTRVQAKRSSGRQETSDRIRIEQPKLGSGSSNVAADGLASAESGEELSRQEPRP